MDYRLLHRHFLSRCPERSGSGQRLLHECLREAIQAGVLAPGHRLPGSRALASELGVARNSVLYAYEQLATEGLIAPHRRGSRVSPLLSTLQTGPTLSAPMAERPLSQRAQRAMPAPRVQESPAAFAAGVPALDAFPLPQWRRLLERRWRTVSPAQLNYAEPCGEPKLRAVIAEHLRATRGVRCEAAQVIVTEGTQASLSLCAQALADAGDRVWIESPGYNGALLAFRAAELRVQGIAVDEQGMAPRAADWRRYPPVLVYTTPSHQYPTGAVMSLERRLALLHAARQAGSWIIEDDYDSEFRHDGPPLPAMQGLEPASPVIYLGTFSKTMFPGLRIAYMVLPQALLRPVHAFMQRAHPRGRAVEQLALADFLRDGLFGLHLRRMRRLYRQRRDALVAAVQEQLGDRVTVHGASAGMHLALQFHGADWDDMAISQAAAEQGLVVQALSELAVGGRAQPWRGLMLGYAQVDAGEMWGCVERLAAVMRGGTE